MRSEYSKILDTIQNANRILFIGHRKPDGDSLGVLCAWSNYLDSINKKYTCFTPDPAPFYYHYLPKLEKVFTDTKKIPWGEVDVVLTLDCGDLRQTGLSEELKRLKGKATLINIDHHISNPAYGDLNLIIPEASSTSEIVFNIFNDLKLPIDKKIATCLLTGIIFDTNNFVNPATTPEAFQAAAELLKYGANYGRIVNYLFRNKSLTSLKLWGKVFIDINLNKQWGIAASTVSLEDNIKYGLSEDFFEGLANFLSNLGEAKLVMILKEEDNGEIRVSLRTNEEKIDVSQLAKFFGGGGHRKAAGFRVKGELKRLENSWVVV